MVVVACEVRAAHTDLVGPSATTRDPPSRSTSLGDLGHSVFTSSTSLMIDSFASPNSITVFGL